MCQTQGNEKLMNNDMVNKDILYLYKTLNMYLYKYIEEIKLLCRKNKVKELYVFGSILSDGFSDKSDIDFIVDIDINDPLDYADYYFSLKFALDDLFERPVDLLEERALKNPFLIEYSIIQKLFFIHPEKRSGYSIS